MDKNLYPGRSDLWLLVGLLFALEGLFVFVVGFVLVGFAEYRGLGFGTYEVVYDLVAIAFAAVGSWPGSAWPAWPGGGATRATQLSSELAGPVPSSGAMPDDEAPICRLEVRFYCSGHTCA